MHVFKKLLGLFTLVLACGLLTGCFDLLEDINIKNDGSGTIKATLNLSKSSTQVASLMKLKSVNGIKIPTSDDIKSETEAMIRILKSTKGISNVQYQLDFTNYIASVSCNFTSIDALNAFSKAVSTHFKSTLGENNNYSYNPHAGKFTRSYTYSPTIGKEYAKISQTDKKLFDEAYYTQIIRFEKTIKSQKHTQAKISSNSKAIFLKLKATELVNGNASLANTIILNN